MDVTVKITLVASLILVGYSLSQLFTSYKAIVEKMRQFKQLMVENDSSVADLKRSNIILTVSLSFIFVLLTYLSGLAMWVVCLLAFKMFATVYLSHHEMAHILKSDSMDPFFFKISKADSFVNILSGAFVAMILIS
ncbi:MAG: hypothetical protein HUK20_13515 [Fibrobacter sp.]|nr:hypothetical protein [Fibrobacter sp.]